MSLEHQKTVSARMSAATRAYRTRMGSHLGHIGLHAGQEGVLKALDGGDGRSMTELAHVLSVQPPTVTKMVSRLAAQGYVERRASEADGRQAQVFLTIAGRAALIEVDEVLKAVEVQALAGIDDKDQRRLRRLLRRIARNLSGENAESDAADDAGD